MEVIRRKITRNVPIQKNTVRLQKTEIMIVFIQILTLVRRIIIKIIINIISALNIIQVQKTVQIIIIKIIQILMIILVQIPRIPVQVPVLVPVQITRVDDLYRKQWLDLVIFYHH